MKPQLLSAGLPLSLRASGVALSAVAAFGVAHAQTASLNEVVVSASGFEQDVNEAPASITVISREQLEEKRTGNLAEALADVEGVDVNADVGKTGGMNISLRGMPSDYTLVLIDGRRQNAAGSVTPNGFGETSTSFMPPVSAIERIEIIRGPMSTLYGSDAMGGVINIITRKVAKVWTGSVTLNGTVQGDSDRGNTYGASAYLSGPIKQDVAGLQLRANTFRRESSKLEPTGDAGNATISSRGPSPVKGDNNSFGGRVSLVPHKDHEIYLDLEAARQSYDNSQGQLGTQGVQGGYGDKQKFNRDQAVLAYNAKLSFGRLETSITRNSTETIGRLVPNGTPGRVPGSARTLDATNTIIDGKLIAPMGDAHLATVGLQHWDAKMIDAVAPAPYKHKQWAIFGEDEWRLHERVALTLGARYDRHNLFGGHFSPRAYAVWNASDALTIKGGVSRGFKTPRLDQIADGITGFTAQGTRPTIGTPSLKPETSTSFELGALYDNKQGFSLGGTVFLNKFKDKIATGDSLPNCSWSGQQNRPGCVDYGSFPAVDTFAQSTNVDRAETRGFELSTRYKINDSISTSANYTFTRSVQKSGANAGQPLHSTPKHMLNAKVDWKINPQWNLWARGEYRSSRWRSDEAARAALGDFKGYAQFHVGGSYQVNKQLSVNAAIYNLFDKDFLKYTSYVNSSGTRVHTSVFNNMQEGRRLWVSMNYTF